MCASRCIGSFVDSEKTRFDFNNPKPMSIEQIEETQKNCQEIIDKSLPVFTEVVPFSEATKIDSLRQMFGERYPSMVRVVSIGHPINPILKNPKDKGWFDYSIELCGGTHLENTKEAQEFLIIHSEHIGGGITRIVGVTGRKAQKIKQIEIQFEKRISDLLELRRKSPREFSKRLAQLNNEIPSSQISTLKKHEFSRKINIKNRKEEMEIFKKKCVKWAQKIAGENEQKEEEKRLKFIVDRCDVGTCLKALEKGIKYLWKEGRVRVPTMLFSVDDGDDDGDEKEEKEKGGKGKKKKKKNRVFVFCMVPEEFDKVDCNGWLQSVLKEIDGKGGGKRGRAQGGGSNHLNVGRAMEIGKEFIEKSFS